MTVGCGMIRALSFLCLTTCTLTACTAFAQLEARVSKDIVPRPALLTAQELQDLLKVGTVTPGAVAENESDLRDRADGLRAR